jgi:hypothetical protein
MANNGDLQIRKKAAHTVACDYGFGKAKKFKNIFASAPRRARTRLAERNASKRIFIHK